MTRDETRADQNRSTVIAVLAGLIAFAVAVLVVAAVQGGDADASTDVSARRLAGEDRYATAVAIATRAFPGGADVVYLVPADGVTDALAAGALRDGPVLLVPRGGQPPASVLEAAQELGPDEVIALGGAGAVTDEAVRAVARAAG